MATETTRTQAGLVCGIREIGTPDIVDIQLPHRPCNPPPRGKAATPIRSQKFPHDGTGAVRLWVRSKGRLPTTPRTGLLFTSERHAAARWMAGVRLTRPADHETLGAMLALPFISRATFGHFA